MLYSRVSERALGGVYRQLMGEMWRATHANAQQLNHLHPGRVATSLARCVAHSTVRLWFGAVHVASTRSVIVCVRSAMLIRDVVKPIPRTSSVLLSRSVAFPHELRLRLRLVHCGGSST